MQSLTIGRLLLVAAGTVTFFGVSAGGCGSCGSESAVRPELEMEAGPDGAVEASGPAPEAAAEASADVTADAASSPEAAARDSEGEAAVDASAVEAMAEAGVDATNAADAADASVAVDAEPDAEGDDAVAPPLGSCAGTSLFTNCSFEMPALSPGGTQLFSNGQTIDGWTVVGATGNVNTVSTTFTQNGCSFPAEDGTQSMDVTGTSNTATGVAQTVTTTPGTEYQVAFWIGNVVDTGGIFGVTSTILVQINGDMAYSATNSSGSMTLSWEEFSFTFVATSSATTIAFINGDPPDDTSNFIDNVSLLPVSGADL